MAPRNTVEIGSDPEHSSPISAETTSDPPAGQRKPSALRELPARWRAGIGRRIGQTRLGRWYLGLGIVGRIGLGFGAAFAMVMVLAVLGGLFIAAVTVSIDGFSRRTDFSQTAADVDIAMRRLEVAVRDQLTDGDADSLDEAGRQRTEIVRRLDQLAAAASGSADADMLAVDEARKALATYWEGLQRIVEIRQELGDQLNRALPEAATQARHGLESLKPAGGVDSTALANEAILALSAIQQHALRFVERRDMMEGEYVRSTLMATRDRLQEMNRYLWVPGTVEHMTAVSAGLDAMGTAFDRIDNLLEEEDARRADVLVPNAALISNKAGELRRSADRAADRLRGELTGRALMFAEVALWVGGGVLLIGLLAAWVVARSVVRPVRAMSDTLHALAVGKTDVTIPRTSHDDEIARMSGALVAVAAATGEMTTALQQTQEENAALSQRLRQVSAVDAAKSDFLINMGQHLHSPLVRMLAQAQALMTELHRQGAVELANDAEVMQWTGERLLEQLDAILDYARIESGQVELCLQDFDIPRLIVEVRERGVTRADLNGNALTATAAPDLGSMHSDFSRVRQALLALVDNGCKFTHNGEVTLTAEKRERDGRSWVVFTVADNGPGFAPQNAAQLFRPFCKDAGERSSGGKGAGGKGGLSKSAARQDGAGLGLTLVAHCAALLGGELELATSPGKGARFALLLPTVYQSEDGDRKVRVRAGEIGGQLGAPVPLLTAIG